MSELSVTVPIEDIKRLHLEPGDVLVATLPMSTPPEVAEKVRARLTEAIPGHEVLVVTDQVKFEVLTPSGIA